MASSRKELNEISVDNVLKGMLTICDMVKGESDVYAGVEGCIEANDVITCADDVDEYDS